MLSTILSGTFLLQKPGLLAQNQPLSFTDTTSATKFEGTNDYTLSASQQNLQVGKGNLSAIKHYSIVADGDIYVKLNANDAVAQLGRVFVVMESSVTNIFISNPSTDTEVNVSVTLAGV